MNSSPTAAAPFKNFIILGHTGLLGRSLMNRLKAAFCDVEVLGYSSQDLNLLDPDQVQKLAPLIGPNTGMIMCSMIKKESGDNLENFSKNLQMAQNLCRLLEKYPLGKLIYLSSAAVYGEDHHNLNISEETPVQPTSYYGLAKFTTEGLFTRCFSGNKNTSLSILRPPVFYGPGDKFFPYGPVQFIHKVLQDKDVVLWGDGKEKREFIFLEDILTTIILLLQKEHQGVLNIVSGTSYTFNDILTGLSQVHPGPLRVVNRPRTKDKVDHQYDNKLFRKVLPHFRFTPLIEGIEKTYQCETINTIL